MFRTKIDVDNHVRTVFRNIKLENERNLRCYNIAKLYYSVGDLYSARHYISTYLSVRPDHAGAHKVLGQAYEGLKQKEKALEAYKRSLEIESKQPDLVLKVCELLLATNPYLSPGIAQYWLERAQEIQAHHPVLFSLKKHVLAGKGDGESPKTDELELLIKKEIDLRPKDVNLQIHLFKLFMETNRKDVAYKHAIELETTGWFRKEILWYQCLSDVMKAYKESVPTAAESGEFHVHNVGILLQQVALLSSQDSQHVPGHSQSLFDLDQALFEANEVLKKKKERLLEECVRHASSQLCLHLGIALLRAGKQSRLGWREYVKQAQPVLLLAAMPRVDVTPVVSKKEAIQKRIKLWEVEKAYCRSQAGHVVLAMVKDGVNQFLNRVNQFCCPGWREKLYQRIFSTAAKEKELATSFFVNYDVFDDVPGSLPSPASLSSSDILSQQLYPESLHHLVWLGLQNWAAQSKKSEYGLDHGLESPLSGFRLSRDFSCTVFEKLQWSTGNLKWSGTESLSRLDVDAFLYASVFCAASSLKRQREKGLSTEERPSVLPADITDPLCSPEQSRWWSMAWQMHSGISTKSLSSPSYGEMRALIQRGLEVIRVLGNHGLDVKLIVLLAKTFEDKASSLSAHFDESSKAAQLDARAHVYWTTALALLERMDKSEMIHMADNRLFRFEGDELSRTEVKTLLEEGRFFMACRLMRAEQYEEAAQSFTQLKSPYASFYQALMYKKMADNVIGDMKSENITSDMRSNHSILLLKARAALHLTLDRVRAPHMHPCHPLNLELSQHLDDVEGQLAHIELNMMNRNACDGTSDESASSRNSAEEEGHHSHTITSSSVVENGGGLKKSFQCSTPVRSRRNVQEKQEARPSPERLDAQLRHLTSTNDTLLQSVLEQNRAILASNKGILEALEKNQKAVQDMQSRISTLQDEMSRLKLSDEMQQIRQEIAKLKMGDIRAASVVRDDKDEELYIFGDDEAAEELGATSPHFPVTYQNPYQQPLASNVQGAGAVRRNVYPAAQPIVPPLLPHNFFPQTQVPMGVGRNVDTASMLYSQNLMSCYSALGLPFDGLQQTPQQPQVPDYSSTPTLVSLLYGNQPPAAVAAQPVPSNVVRPQFTQMPMMSFGSPAVNIRPPTVMPSTPGVVAAQPADLSTPKFAFDSAPHNYQISMPAQATIPSAASVEKNLSPSQPISTCALLKDVPSPVYSAVTTPANPVKQSQSQSPGERQSRTSICSEDGSYAEETECEGDFTPLIPLPEEVTVTTGEENETVLFDERAKLYRYVDGEWKERGIGQMKVLQHRDTKKSRILMRRDQVHKICANHQITADIEFSKHCNSENSLIWFAQDYAEEVVNLEKFCVRFKTPEQTARFQRVCEEARELNKTLITPTKASLPTVAFSSTTITTPASVVTCASSTPSFAFKIQPSNSSFSTPLQSMASWNISPAATKTPTAANAGSGDDSNVEEYTPSINYTPVIPLPDEVQVVTGEENEKVLLSNRAKLYRFVEGQWKDRGVGDIKILEHKENGRVRLVMRRDQTHKVCANHSIVADIELQPLGNNKRQWIWCAPDFAEEVVNVEKFCAKFKTEDEGLQFKKAFDEARELSKVAKSPIKPPAVTSTPAKPAPVLFGQPATFGSESTGEKVTLGGFTLSCKPAVKPAEEVGKSETDSAAQAKPNPFSGVNFSSAAAPVFGSSKVDAMPSFSSLASSAKSSDAKETAAPDQRPLSEMFKPKAGSWSCPGCYASNTTDVCPCCRTPKPGTEAARPAAKPNVFSGTGGAQFSFGIPQASKTETAPSTTGLFGGSSAAKTQTANVSAVVVAPTTQAAETPKSSADNRPLSELFKPKEGAWNCPACYASNTAERTSCICCKSPKPGCEGKPEGPKSKVDLSTGGQTFNFGIPCGTQGSPAAAPAVSTFAFGSSTITAPNPATKKVLFNLPAATPTYSFGMPNQDEAKFEAKPKDAGYVFGASSVTTSSSIPPAGNAFSFGSSSFGFNFEGVKNEKSPIKSPGKDATSGEEGESDYDEDHDHLQYKPIIPLPDKVAVVTGEEDETVLYSQHAKLYRYSISDKQWKERGTGAVKILRHVADGRLRLLMRRDQIYKLCLNHFLTPDIEFTARDPKSWTWSAPDFSEGEVETSMFAIRFKAPEIASDFISAIDKALINYASPGKKQADKGVKEQCSTSEKSGVARVLFKESTSAPSGDDEIEIVYETSVSPEEREAALKLKLPVYFYSYRRAPPCKGCAGCEKDEDESEQPGKEKPSPAVTLSFSNAAGDTAAKPAVPLAQSFWNAASPSKPVNFSFGLSNNFSSPSSTTIFGGKTPIGSSDAPATGSIFGGTPSTTSATTIFGGATSVTPVFGAAATTTTITTTSSTPIPATIFGGATSVAPIFGAAATTTTITTTSSTPTPATIFGGATSVTPVFGAAAKTTTKATTSSTPTPATIFGGATSVAPIFGAAAATTTITTTSSTPTPATIFGGATSVTPIFGAAATTTTITTTSSTPIFGGSGVASSQTQIFSKPVFSFSTAAPALSSTNSNPPVDSNKNLTSNAAPTFGSAASNAPSFGSLPSIATASEDDAVPFLPVDSSLSFAAVAQASTIAKALTTQESNKAFQFAGAGSQVFGVSTPKTDKLKSKAKKDDGESSGDEGDCLDAHDPQFKPIIPLPDAIEVRTGEEDEEKLFCERAKVYRYGDKEWKERGVGEMKILFHPARNSYRLLLRREQVHKVVLNQPLTADVELSPMSSSETSWCWGGMNYAEEPDGNLEKLAVKFKNAQFAKNFKETLESCQERLRLNASSSADQGGTDVIEESANSASDEMNREENPYQSYDYFIDPADVVSYENLFEETGALEENYDGSWKPVGEATAILFVDSQTGSGSIIVKKDDTIVCQTAQSEDDTYTVNGNYFEWTSFDLCTGSHRILRINFPSEGPALEFKAKLEGIVPIGEEIVVEEEDEEEEVEEEEEEDEEGEGEEEEEWQREE